MLIRAQEMARYWKDVSSTAAFTGYDWDQEQNADVKEVAELNYAKEGLRRCAGSSPYRTIPDKDRQGPERKTHCHRARRVYQTVSEVEEGQG